MCLLGRGFHTLIKNALFFVLLSNRCEISKFSHQLGRRTCASEDIGPRKEVDCEIPHQLGRKTKHSLYGCGNLSLRTRFENLEEKLEKKNLKRTYLLAVGLGF